MTFHLFVVHSVKLAARQNNLHGVIQTIRTTAQDLGHIVKINMIVNPDPDSLKPDIETLDKRIKYDKVGNEDFDKHSTMLTLEELSNYEKQREVWHRISELPQEDMFMVIEDDAFFLPNANTILREILAAAKSTSYDFITLCLSEGTTMPSDPVVFQDFRETGSILPSKDAYLLSKRAARTFYAQTDTITFHVRIQMSYILHKNVSLVSKYPNHRAMIEGSKLGLFPSSTHANNVLIYNQEFMDLFKFLQTEKPPVREIREIYKKVAHINNPDIMHIYGVLLYKAGELHDAQDALTSAVEHMQKQGGLLTPASELLNNFINIHQHTQWDLPDLIAKPSKYSSPIP